MSEEEEPGIVWPEPEHEKKWECHPIGTRDRISALEADLTGKDKCLSELEDEIIRLQGIIDAEIKRRILLTNSYTQEKGELEARKWIK